jgi:hypothetical protein
MMKTVAAAALVGALATMSAGGASAASLGLAVAAGPLISGQGDAFHDPLGLGFDLLGAPGGASSSAPAVAIDLDVFVPSAFLDLSGPFFGGALFVRRPDFSDFLSGDLVDVGFVTSDQEFTDTIELLFGNLGGSAAGAFGTRVLLTLFGEFGMEGDDPIVNGFASFDDPAFVSFTIAPIAAIPLPATAPLLLTALVGAGFLARRRGSTRS